MNFKARKTSGKKRSILVIYANEAERKIFQERTKDMASSKFKFQSYEEASNSGASLLETECFDGVMMSPGLMMKTINKAERIPESIILDRVFRTVPDPRGYQ